MNMKAKARRLVKEKALAVALASIALALSLLAGCSANTAASGSGEGSSSAAEGSASASSKLALEDRAVIRDTNFGGVYIDATVDEFNEMGFAFGDTVDIAFSNGYTLTGIPYYSGYYVRMGDPLLVGYPGYPHVEAAINYGDSLWDVAGLAEGDTATVTLAEAGKNRDVQEAFALSYTNNRADYPSDEAFANFRALKGGSLKPDFLYRSASPVDNEYGRVPYVESFMKQAGVSFVLDLSDSDEEIDAFIAEDEQAGVDYSYFAELRDKGCVAALDLSASYSSQKFKETLASGLIELAQHDGPYLVHCIEGKDRTGFVCALLEGLAGATYDEMLADYMITFDNYYGIDQAGDPEKYAAIANLNLDGMLSYLAGVDDGADLRAIDYSKPARDYLRAGGMTDEQIDSLAARICGDAGGDGASGVVREA